MKNRIIKLFLLATALVVVTASADAQTKRTSKKRTTTKKTTSKNTTAAVAAPAKDTTKPVAALPEPELNLGTIRKSLRNDNAIERNLVKDRNPLS